MRIANACQEAVEMACKGRWLVVDKNKFVNGGAVRRGCYHIFHLVFICSFGFWGAGGA